MRTAVRTATTLLALSGAVLILGACGEDDAPASVAAPDVVADPGDGGAAGTVEEGTTAPGDVDACAVYLADGQALQFAYDEYGSGGTGDATALVDSLEELAADADELDEDRVSEVVLGTAQEVSEAAAAAVPALAGGAG
jgi:hypothetical protein